MICFVIIGTNWITHQFIDAAHESGKLQLTAIYSRLLTLAALWLRIIQLNRVLILWSSFLPPI